MAHGLAHRGRTAFAGALKFGGGEKKRLRHRAAQRQLQLLDGQSGAALPSLATKGGLADGGKCEFAAMKLERQRPAALQTPFIWNHSATVCLGTQLRGSEGRERFVITTVLRNTSDGHHYRGHRYYHYAGPTPSSHNTNTRDRLCTAG